MKKLIAFIKLSRLMFLSGGFIFYGLGVSIAYNEGYQISPEIYVVGQLIVTLTQLMLHYSNDYFDYPADMLNHAPSYWSGGSRMLIRGELPIRTALYAAIFCATAASILSLILTFMIGNFWLLPILLLSIGLSWSYSSPPLKLHSQMLGEFFGTLILAFFTPLIGYYTQAETISTTFILALIPLLFLQFNMLLSVNVPDAESDTKVGKTTLVVGYGKKITAQFYLSALLLTYLSLPILILLGLPTTIALATLLPLPLAIALFIYIFRKGWRNPNHWNLLTFSTISLLMGTATLEMIGFIIQIK